MKIGAVNELELTAPVAAMATFSTNRCLVPCREADRCYDTHFSGQPRLHAANRPPLLW